MPITNRFAGTLLPPAALFVAPATLAQAQQPPPTEAAEGDPAPDVSELHLPGYGTPANRTWLEFEVAPELVSHNPLGSASRTSDETSVSLTFITTQPLSRSLEFEFDVGPSTTIDTDRDASFE